MCTRAILNGSMHNVVNRGRDYGMMHMYAETSTNCIVFNTYFLYIVMLCLSKRITYHEEGLVYNESNVEDICTSRIERKL